MKKLYLFNPKFFFMKRITLILCSVLLLTTVKNLYAQQDPMKAYQDFMTPGAMHKWMAKFNGTWEADITGYMDPTKPEKSKATNVNSTIMNGLYQVGDYTGNMMGMHFQGHSIMGYDNAKKMFVNTWIDNMGSGMILMTGKDSEIREVMQITDDNNYTLKMYGTGPDGKEMIFMEGAFKRKK